MHLILCTERHMYDTYFQFADLTSLYKMTAFQLNIIVVNSYLSE